MLTQLFFLKSQLQNNCNRNDKFKNPAMKIAIVISLAALTFAFPGSAADPLANPFALDPRSIGGKCDHNVR
jgi:hypothetical protein